jgi:hypothetical protein
MAVAKRIDGNLSKKGTIHAGQPIDNKGPDAGLYHSTIEINDFPLSLVIFRNPWLRLRGSMGT